jgi:hypothetical protein
MDILLPNPNSGWLTHPACPAWAVPNPGKRVTTSTFLAAALALPSTPTGSIPAHTTWNVRVAGRKPEQVEVSWIV